MSSSQAASNREIVLEFIEVMLNQGNIEAADNYFCQDVVEQVPFPGQRPGIDGIKDVLQGLCDAFTDMHWTVIEQICEDEKVLSRFEWTGKHTGEFLGVAPTYNTVNVWGMLIDHFQDGKIKETRIIMDTLGLLIQLGAVPAPNN